MDLATELLQTIADRLIGLERLERQFDGLNERFDGLNERFDGLNERFDGLNGRFDGLTETVAANGQRLDRLEALSEATNTTLRGIQEQNRFTVRYLRSLAERDGELGTEVSALKRRVDALEEHTGLKDEI